MGMCATPGGSLDNVIQAVQIASDDEISAHMREQRTHDKLVSKLLLLGTGNTGKSTFFRQFKMQYADGISMPERQIYRAEIRDQVVFYMRRLVDVCLKKQSEQIIEEESFAFSDEISALIETHWKWESDALPSLDMALGRQINTLWHDEHIHRVYFQDVSRYELCIPVSCEYFFDEVERIAHPDFWPTDKDCITAYNRTSGITSLDYSFKGEKFHVVDIGGQRSERRKWIHVFDDVNALLYVVSLSAYDEVLFENRHVNAMTEQLDVFNETVNLACFNSTTVIVFLNKSDLLQQKIDNGRPISQYFDDYEGDGSFDSSTSFIRKRLRKLNKSKDRKIFFHTTCATDPENAKRVLGDVTAMIVGKSLENQGFF